MTFLCFLPQTFLSSIVQFLIDAQGLRASSTGGSDSNHLQGVEMHKSKQKAIWVRCCVPVRDLQCFSKSINQWVVWTTSWPYGSHV